MSRRRVTLAWPIANIALAIAALAVALVGLELMARLLASTLGLSSYMRYDPIVGWSATPGAVKRHKDPANGFDVTYTINAEGTRGRAYPREKPPSATRVVLLGDSIGFGWGIPEGAHFSALLEQAMPGVQLLNLALSGYSTDQELLRFRRDGVPFRPDIVLLQVAANDFGDLLHPFSNQKPKPYFELDDEGGLILRNVPVEAVGERASEYYRRSLPIPFRPWLEWNSYAYSYLNAQYFTARHRFGSPASSADPPGMISKGSVALFNRLVEALAADLEGLRATGYIVHAAPELGAAAVIRPTLPIIDASSAFLAARQNGIEPWFRDGYHWNAAGNRIMADAVVRAIAPVTEKR